MATAISFTFNGSEYYAKELTARQLDQVIGGPARRLARQESAKETPEAPGLRIFDLLFYDEPVSSLAVTLSTGITLEQLDGDVSPVELETVMLAVKEANPFLVRAVSNGDRIARGFEQWLEKTLASSSAGRPTS